jgi:hypothetical protein
MTNQALGPFSIRFQCHVQTKALRALAAHVIGLFAELEFPQIERWSDLMETVSGGNDDFAQAANILPERAPTEPDARVQIDLLFEGPLLGHIFYDPQWGEDSLAIVDLRWLVDDGKVTAATLQFQERCVQLCARVMERFPVYAAELSPEDGGATAIPEVPLVTGNSHIVVTNAEEAEELYDDPVAFWNAGWTRAVEVDGQVLLTRALDRAAGARYLSAIIEHQWDMARAAKPGEAAYTSPVVDEAECEVFNAGEPRLHFVGYNAKDQLAEYSCAAEPGEHIQGWEIFALHSIVANKALPDGHPLDTVRIVFLEEEAARLEKRPLLDVGCRVYTYRDDGELHELTE